MHSVRMYLASTRASATRPAIAMPTWSSILKIFFWCEESSLAERLSVAMIAILSDRSPIAALPCLTASRAYSIWWMRPAGDQVVQSVSYWLRNISPPARGVGTRVGRGGRAGVGYSRAGLAGARRLLRGATNSADEWVDPWVVCTIVLLVVPTP